MMMKKDFYVKFSDCIICEECSQETTMHLFFECSSSQWWAVGFEWNSDLDINNMILEGRNRYPY
jgi:hypothetical protein